MKYIGKYCIHAHLINCQKPVLYHTLCIGYFIFKSKENCFEGFVLTVVYTFDK